MQVMAYDGGGSRVLKQRELKAHGQSDWVVDNTTHYSGIGTEVRESYFGGAMNNAKVVVNLPQGLGRYQPEDAVDGFNGVSGSQLAGYRPPAKFEWYLKNHIGSTMLVYGTSAYNDKYSSYAGGVKAAYDYRAFGEQVSLAEPAEKVTENFTGNEKDDEIELNYFGARYLDPMLGMWASVDPARQFSSPYLYAGNGMNPIVGVDEDGESMQFVAGFFTSIPIAAYNMVMAEKEAYEAHMSYWSIVERGVSAWVGTLFLGAIFNPSSAVGVMAYGAGSSALIDVLLQMGNCNSDFDWNRVASAAAGGAMASSLALGAEKLMSNYVLGSLAEGVAGFAASAAWTTFMVFAEPSPESAPDPIEQCEDE